MYPDFEFAPLGGGIRIALSDDHRFGTDAILLADFVRIAPGERVCDLCTGVGILPLLWCKESGPKPKSIHALDIQPEAIELLRLSVKENGLDERIIPVEGDLRSLKGLLPAAGFDVVSCNPPYFSVGSGVASGESARAAARHEGDCTLEEACAAAKRLLRFGGRFSLCHRPERLADLMTAMRGAGLEPKRLRMVQKKAGCPPWLLLLEGKKGGKPGLLIEAPLLMQKEDGKATDELKIIYGEG